MAEYSREQRNQLSRAVANSETGNRQMKNFIDNRKQIERSTQFKMIIKNIVMFKMMIKVLLETKGFCL